MGRLKAMQVPSMGGWSRMVLSQKVTHLAFHRPHSASLAVERRHLLLEYAAPTLFGLLSVDQVLFLLGCLCCERKVLVVSDHVNIVSSCVLALITLLHPLQWAGPVITVLPPRLNELLEAPVPLIAGRVSISSASIKNFSTLERPMRDVIEMNMDQHALHMHDEDLVTYHELKLPECDELVHELEPFSAQLFGKHRDPDFPTVKQDEACKIIMFALQAEDDQNERDELDAERDDSDSENGEHDDEDNSDDIDEEAYADDASQNLKTVKQQSKPKTSKMQHVAPPSPPVNLRDVISWHAYVSGIKTGAMTGMAAGAGVLVANKYWPAFRTRLNVSGKTALALMPAMAVFSVVSEQRILYGARNPDRYLASMGPNFMDLNTNKQSSLQMYQRVANYWYDHPYRVLAMVGVPLVGGIFAYQSMNTAIQRSQQIMHARLYGQTAVVGILLSSMAFNDYMKNHGRFVEEEDNDS
ncbi:hypothetical protein BBO99_00003977 [Phytophthora kernoviae]|uniref:UDENN domain-containing protein n=2 Tax=Phytophthora kernoviae TaxID=325452 RepID=A0A3R7G468_9STRA|nr:hypothetical protein G195_004468 [Phytophthora kernoviae 00238/432]KAG2526441.1 hypothetical protein JM16_003812 [Phytophthora kernoviae]KAG2528078.1 hypothetical protein JM18_003392 [Phytophthora kernoviae]RLN31960.1 hypothetical protein BBI17_004012 [Phytophthora kernoviae]RLN81099.1 hypothetical protein BBO99_00003977 [Phytophthora kernoviae]